MFYVAHHSNEHFLPEPQGFGSKPFYPKVADRVLGMWKDGLLDSDTAAQILGQAALDMASPAAAPSSASAPDVLDARKRAHIEIEKVAEDQEQDDLDKVFEDAKRHKLDSRHACHVEDCTLVSYIII